MKIFLIFLNIFLLTKFLPAQDYHIELAVSYDQLYENMVSQSSQWNGTVEERIYELIQTINDRAYEKYNVIFDIAVIENFGDIGDLPDDDIAVQTITALWNSKCYEKDLILHLTGSLEGYAGVSSGSGSGSNLCNSNQKDFIYNGTPNYYVQIVTFNSYLLGEASTIAHELGHGIGLSHEDDDDSSSCIYPSTNFMCSTGPDIFDGEWTLSPYYQNIVETKMENLDCINIINFNPNVECTERYAFWDLDSEIGMDCNEGVKTAKFKIQNDNTIRSFTGISLSYSPIQNNELVLSGEFIESLTFNQEFNHFEIDNFTLKANETYEFEIEVNSDNITTDISPGNNLAAYLIFNCETSTPKFGDNSYGLNKQAYIFDRTIIMENNSTTSDLLTALDQMYNSGDFSKAKTYEISINGTFIVDEDLTLDKKHRLHMKENSRIEVVNGSTFKFSENEIISCDGERWDQIYVENGSNLFFSNIQMENGINGINTEESTEVNPGISSIRITDCIIKDFAENGVSIRMPSSVIIKGNRLSNIGNYGIYLKGIEEIIEFEDNEITNAENGIRITNTSHYFNIDSCTLKNCSNGISLGNASGLINKCTFEQCSTGIYCYKSPLTEIANNTIGYSKYGIQLLVNSNLNIHNNAIGHEHDYGETGINFLWLDNTRIYENPSLYAERMGLKGSHANIHFYKNALRIDDDNLIERGGVRITEGFDCDIVDNYINVGNSLFGIESNNSHGNEIRNNAIRLYNTDYQGISAILSTGSIGEIIEKNETYSFWGANGIEAQNSSGNTYECNYIYDAQNAMKIGHNAEIHTILTNQFIDPVDNDLEIHSIPGVQNHHGNKFMGGKAKAYLDFSDDETKSKSWFLVNRTYEYHMPEDPEPGENEWFFHEDKLDENCGGSPGTGWFSSYDDPAFMCRYYQFIKSKYAIKQPHLFFIKLLHLMRYHTKKSETPLPDCIRLDPEFLRLCGLREMLSAIWIVSKTMKISDGRSSLEQSISELWQLNKNYTEENDFWVKINLFNQINQLYSQIKHEVNLEQKEDELSLREVRDNIASIDCQEEILIHMKYVWLTYLDLLLSDEDNRPLSLDPNIDRISRLCADEYGDVVHLARSIASIQGGTEIYTQFDGCKDRIIEPREANKVEENVIQIVPNPNSGKANLYFKNSTFGHLVVVNSEGKSVFSEQLSGVRNKELNIDVPGMYVVSVTENTGNVLLKKMIIVQ